MAITLPGFLAKIASGAGEGLLNGAGNLVSDCLAGKINRDTLDAKIKELTQAHSDNIINQISSAYTSDLADVASARGMNTSIETSDKSSWMSKNITPIIAICVMTIWGASTCYLVLRMLHLISTDPKVDLVPVLGVYTGITSVATIVLTFYFGSSANSQKHSDALTEIAKNNQN